MTATPPEQAWFAKADADLELARRALWPDQPLPDMACFHAQQCAEKYLKGYLVARDVPFRYVHDLRYLLGLCTGLNPTFADLKSATEILNEYLPITRYPTEGGHEPDLEAAQQAIRLAEQIAAAVVRS